MINAARRRPRGLLLPRHHDTIPMGGSCRTGISPPGSTGGHDDDYSPSRCVGINSATRTRRREDDDRTNDGLICGDARRYGITTTKCHAEPRSSRRTRLRREPELVTYELIHAHFVQDIFEVITIYLKIQLHIAISETSNFL